MIYRRGVREVIDEVHCRLLGVHILLVYAAAAACIAGLAAAGLFGIDRGYFSWHDTVSVTSGMTIEYSTSYGWARACTDSSVSTGLHSSSLEVHKAIGCASLAQGVTFDGLDLDAAPGGWLMRGAGLSVCVGQAAIAVAALFFAVVLLLLHGNIVLLPRGFNHMCAMGTTFIAGSLYLVFACVVAFYLCVRGSIENTMGQVDMITPGWAYGVTVASAGLLVLIGTLAILDGSAIDVAVACPQYTSSVDQGEKAAATLRRVRERGGTVELEQFDDAKTDIDTEDNTGSVAPIA